MKRRLLRATAAFAVILIVAPFAVALGVHQYGLSKAGQLPQPEHCDAVVEGELLDTWRYWGGTVPAATEPIGPIRYWFKFFAGQQVVPYNSPQWPGLLPAFHVARLHLAQNGGTGKHRSELPEVSLALYIVSNWSPCEVAKYLQKHGPNRSVPADHDPRERGSRPLNSNR